MLVSCRSSTRPLHPDHPSSDFLDRLIAQDADAYAELVRAHGPRLLSVASRYLRCQADAEDAVQEAFVNVVRYVAGFNRDSKLETWLHRIVVNCALMILRTRRRRPVLTNAEAEMFGEMESPTRRGAVASPSARLERDEEVRLLRESIGALPPVQQTTFQFRHESGMQVHAIAAMLEVSPSTVKTRLHRARRALQSALA